MTKKHLVIYSGHGKIVGGDAKYLTDLVAQLPLNEFEILIATDENSEFQKIISPQFPEEIKIVYLDTRPIIFQKILSDKLFKVIKHKSKSKAWAKILKKLFAFPMYGRELIRYLRYIEVVTRRILTFAFLREWSHNRKIFNRFFSELSKPVDIFHTNNGGYPAKIACLTALSVAKEKKIPVRILTIHSSAIPRKLYRTLLDKKLDPITQKSSTHIITTSAVTKSSLVEKGMKWVSKAEQYSKKSFHFMNQ